MNDMTELFILQNQDNLFFGKQKEWLDGRDTAALYKTPFKDEAVNQMFEISSKDYTQRIKVLTCAASDKGLPLIPEDLLPPPLPKVAKRTAEERRNIDAFEALEAQRNESAETTPTDHEEISPAPLSDEQTPMDDLTDDGDLFDREETGRSDTL